MSDDPTRAADIAVQIATTEMLRLVINEALYTDDFKEFQRRLTRFEELAVNEIKNRRNFDDANDATESYIREIASGYVSGILSSILHPDDPRRERT